jgi:hypothetical protein
VALVHKPADAHDLCLTTNGATDLTDVGLGTDACPVKFQSSPRQIAGGPLAEDVFKCTLKPLNFSDSDYTGIAFTDDQQTRLRAVFPDGVCDWSQPGVMQVAADGGTTFEAGPGGEPLGGAPESTLGPPILTALNPAKVWIGLKNSDDVGAKFDLKAEVFNGDTLIGTGQLNGAAGGGSGFGNAKLNTIALNLTSTPQDLPEGTLLSVRVSARISCSARGHASASARLWFNDPQASSRFAAMIDGVSTDYYLRVGSSLEETQGQGPRSDIDVLLNSKDPCPDRPFTSVGAWSISLD